MPRQSTKTSQPVSFKTSWPPDSIHRLLLLVAASAEWSEAVFPHGDVRVKDLWMVYRDINVAYFQENGKWQRDMALDGFVKKKAGAWEPTMKWTSGTYNPVSTRLTSLKKEFRTKSIVAGYQLDPSWTTVEDLPESARGPFQKTYPYFFLLKRLCEHGTLRSPERSYSWSDFTAASRKSAVEPSNSLTNRSQAAAVDPCEDGILSVRAERVKARNTSASRENPQAQGEAEVLRRKRRKVFGQLQLDHRNVDDLVRGGEPIVFDQPTTPKSPTPSSEDSRSQSPIPFRPASDTSVEPSATLVCRQPDRGVVLAASRPLGEEGSSAPNPGGVGRSLGFRKQPPTEPAAYRRKNAFLPRCLPVGGPRAMSALPARPEPAWEVLRRQGAAVPMVATGSRRDDESTTSECSSVTEPNGPSGGRERWTETRLKPGTLDEWSPRPVTAPDHTPHRPQTPPGEPTSFPGQSPLRLAFPPRPMTPNAASTQTADQYARPLTPSLPPSPTFSPRTPRTHCSRPRTPPLRAHLEPHEMLFRARTLPADFQTWWLSGEEYAEYRHDVSSACRDLEDVVRCKSQLRYFVEAFEAIQRHDGNTSASTSLPDLSGVYVQWVEGAQANGDRLYERAKKLAMSCGVTFCTSTDILTPFEPATLVQLFLIDDLQQNGNYRPSMITSTGRSVLRGTMLHVMQYLDWRYEQGRSARSS